MGVEFIRETRTKQNKPQSVPSAAEHNRKSEPMEHSGNILQI